VSGGDGARLTLAAQMIDRGQSLRAVELLRELLGQEPEEPRAHALLAQALFGARRLVAAEHEAQTAVRLSPDWGFAHLVLGRVLVAARRLDQAEEHLTAAASLAPDEAATLRGLALLRSLRGDRRQARELLERALGLDAEDPETHCALARHHLAAGELQSAEQHARAALELGPDHATALALMGNVLLRRGDLAGARDHALFVLRSRPTDHEAIHLLTGVKARQSVWLGLWWRWNDWMAAMEGRHRILFLVAMYVVYRLGLATAEVTDQDQLGTLLELSWLGLCVYSWTGPALFRRMIDRELATVQLREGF
jgi:Tfp pilus assembly protein PilF